MERQKGKEGPANCKAVMSTPGKFKIRKREGEKWRRREEKETKERKEIKVK